MPYLAPGTVARAARALFGTGHAESIAFFYLKAEGGDPDSDVRFSSRNEPPDALRRIARQPDGFDELVEDNLDRFAEANDYGYPTRPGARGTTEDYTMFWPVAEEAQYLLRKDDCNRNAVYSNLTGGRSALNADRAELSDVIEVREADGTGKIASFQEGYPYAASWYYGPDEGEPMRVPLSAMAVWLHRSDEVPAGVSIDDLIDRARDHLNVTDEELYAIYETNYPFPIGEDDLVSEFDLLEYFETLCLPGDEVDVDPVSVSQEVRERAREDYEFWVETLRLRSEDREEPEETARESLSVGRRNLLLYGPPRTGKSYSARDLAADYLEVDRSDIEVDDRFTWVQFHQGWSYGDFIRKLVPVGGTHGLEFRPSSGVFLDHCTRNADRRSVFVIEELNRASVADVFGEAFQLVEEDYRGSSITLPAHGEEEEPPQLRVPEDLLLIATANDLDRSTLPLDFALLSRFSTISFPVRYDQTFGILSGRPSWTQRKVEAFVELLREIESISGYPVGHAYFYDFGPPESVRHWYRTELRTALKNYLTEHREDDLRQIDALIEEWLER